MFPGAGAEINLQFCAVTAPPVPPSNIANVHVVDMSVRQSENALVTLVVQWSKPEYLNGNAEIGPTYQLWIGIQKLPPKADLVSYHNQKLFFDPDIKVSNL